MIESIVYRAGPTTTRPKRIFWLRQASFSVHIPSCSSRSFLLEALQPMQAFFLFFCLNCQSPTIIDLALLNEASVSFSSGRGSRHVHQKPNQAAGGVFLMCTYKPRAWNRRRPGRKHYRCFPCARTGPTPHRRQTRVCVCSQLFSKLKVQCRD